MSAPMRAPEFSILDNIVIPERDPSAGNVVIIQTFSDLDLDALDAIMQVSEVWADGRGATLCVKFELCHLLASLPAMPKDPLLYEALKAELSILQVQLNALINEKPPTSEETG